MFGFPCNDFSIVSDRNGIQGKYGALYRWGIAALRAQKPFFFVAENVSGLPSSSDALDVICGELIASDYHIARYKCKFEEYGVPQARHRILIVGFRKDLKITGFEHPHPTTKDNPPICSEALEDIKPGENAFTADIPMDLQLNMKSNALSSRICRRLDPSKPSYTLIGSGGGVPMCITGKKIVP